MYIPMPNTTRELARGFRPVKINIRYVKYSLNAMVVCTVQNGTVLYVTGLYKTVSLSCFYSTSLSLASGDLDGEDDTYFHSS